MRNNNNNNNNNSNNNNRYYIQVMSVNTRASTGYAGSGKEIFDILGDVSRVFCRIFNI